MRARLAALALLLPILAACVQLPESGPVVNGGSHGIGDGRPPSDIEPEPPQPGQSRLDVVNGFLEAMTAWPISTTIAKQYLTSASAQRWNPSAGTVVYTNFAPPTDEAGRVTVRLSGAARLDPSGAWSGEVPAAGQTLRFHVVREGGGYRIADPPDEMVVPASWFQQRFGEVSLYYFDPRARFLVAEPVFVPSGGQLPTALVSALLSGPPHGLDGVVRTFVPAGLRLAAPVPVTDGIAEIDLTGGARPSAEEAENLLNQVGATLSQDPDLVGFRVTLDTRPIATGISDRIYPVDLDAALNPVAQAPANLYGVEGGRLVGGDPTRMQPVSGPLGSGAVRIDSVAVAPSGQDAVAVTDGGTTAIEAPLTAQPHAAPRTLLTGATALVRPTIDVPGRVWLLDRGRRGAVVRCWCGGRLTRLEMPGVTGQDARQLLVSRDGTRLIAVVHGSAGDHVVGARVATGSRARPPSLVDPFRVPVGLGRQILDIAWATPTRLAVLSPTRAGSLYQVDILPVDGSTIGGDSVSTVIGGRVIGLAGSPDPDLATYAILKRALVDVRSRIETPLGARLSNLTYPG